MAVIRLKKNTKRPQIPEAADPRFKAFSNEDLYVAYEQAIAGAIAEMEAGRASKEKRLFHLDNCSARLADALSAVEAMKQRGL